ncbi:MAG TPA: type VI secretion system baseplate subunit TssE [Aquabacterium sp.]|uniref:type VI secretion system baseplate subunit TssE n=1 Tax=Aquabacterium sp. TaxID=1872578 RepID=UPI002E30E4A3|nr:type VI secretion system baseplate subunit TssE [Aquabacterium sp.]HEX5356853.1 type VI secretion system baseplate subunit TssE [Aquabacterium sp.]
MRFQSSLWDRLLVSDTPRADVYLGVDLNQLKAQVARDLERLLNTRRCYDDEDFAGFPLTGSSIFNFGIPDFSAKSLSSGVDRDQICQAMAKAIERYDPRLRNVMVRLRDTQSEVHRLAFDIHAMLRVTGFQDAVSFGAQFDSAGMYYQVSH